MQHFSSTVKRVLLDKFPLIGSVLVMVVMTYLPNVVAAELAGPLENVDLKLATLVYCALSPVIAFVILALFEWWLRPEYEGTITGNGLGLGLKLLLPVIIFWALWTPLKTAMGFMKAYPLDFEALIKGIRPGVVEEAAYRGMALGVILKKYHKRDKIWIPIVFTSIAFGLMHLTNLIGDDVTFDMVWRMSVSILFATVFGTIFALAFTLCGSIWPTIIVHSAYDTLTNCFSYVDSSPDWVVYIDVVATIALMVLLAVMFHRMRDKAEALWDKKWGQA